MEGALTFIAAEEIFAFAAELAKVPVLAPGILLAGGLALRKKRHGPFVAVELLVVIQVF